MTRASDPTLESLRQKLRKHMEDIGDNIITGSCHSFEEYTHQTGVIEGLAWAERELLDLSEAIEHR